jgi:hypothetical protein
MVDIKSRWDLINKKLSSSGFKKNRQNTEFICLQFRMIIEIIYLANLSSHEGYYKKLLFELVNMWKIHEITEEITSVNKDFYPQTIEIYHKEVEGRPEAAGEIHFLKPVSLPQDESVKIYAKCGEYLHPQNPFAKDKNYEEVFRLFALWSKKIRSLLSKHTIQLVNQDLKIFCFIDFDNIGKLDEVQVGFTHRVN